MVPERGMTWPGNGDRRSSSGRGPGVSIKGRRSGRGSRVRSGWVTAGRGQA